MKVLLLSALLALSSVAAAQDKQPPEQRGTGTPAATPADPNAALIDFQRPCYPLKACAACAAQLDQKSAVPVVVDRRLVLVCADACKAGVEAKKADIFKAIDEGVIAAQKANYPLEKCPISGEKLGGMGEPVDKVVGMRLVRLCCKNCVGKVEGDPEPTLGKLNKAYIASQKAAYGVTVCPVSNHALEEGKAVDALYGTTLVRLCSEECRTTLNRAPQRVINRLENLRAGKPFDDDAGKEAREKKHDGSGEGKEKKKDGEGRGKVKDGEKTGGEKTGRDKTGGGEKAGG